MAEVIAAAIRQLDPSLIIFAPPGSALEQASRHAGLQTAAEVFADRNYNADGSLVSRDLSNALLRDPHQAAERIIGILREQKVTAIDGTHIPIRADTVCVHGDTPGAVSFVRTLRARLEENGVTIAAAVK